MLTGRPASTTNCLGARRHHQRRGIVQRAPANGARRSSGRWPARRCRRRGRPAPAGRSARGRSGGTRLPSSVWRGSQVRVISGERISPTRRRGDTSTNGAFARSMREDGAPRRPPRHAPPAPPRRPDGHRTFRRRARSGAVTGSETDGDHAEPPCVRARRQDGRRCSRAMVRSFHISPVLVGRSFDAETIGPSVSPIVEPPSRVMFIIRTTTEYQCSTKMMSPCRGQALQQRDQRRPGPDHLEIALYSACSALAASTSRIDRRRVAIGGRADCVRRRARAAPSKLDRAWRQVGR